MPPATRVEEVGIPLTAYLNTGNWDWWTSTRDKPGDNVSDVSDMFSRRMNQQQSRQSWVASVAQYARVI